MLPEEIGRALRLARKHGKSYELDRYPIAQSSAGEKMERGKVESAVQAFLRTDRALKSLLGELVVSQKLRLDVTSRMIRSKHTDKPLRPLVVASLLQNAPPQPRSELAVLARFHADVRQRAIEIGQPSVQRIEQGIQLAVATRAFQMFAPGSPNNVKLLVKLYTDAAVKPAGNRFGLLALANEVGGETSRRRNDASRGVMSQLARKDCLFLGLPAAPGAKQAPAEDKGQSAPGAAPGAKQAPAVDPALDDLLQRIAKPQYGTMDLAKLRQRVTTIQATALGKQLLQGTDARQKLGLSGKGQNSARQKLGLSGKGQNSGGVDKMKAQLALLENHVRGLPLHERCKRGNPLRGQMEAELIQLRLFVKEKEREDTARREAAKKQAEERKKRLRRGRRRRGRRRRGGRRRGGRRWPHGNASLGDRACSSRSGAASPHSGAP